MNKAFVREPEDTGQGYCPRCQSLGVPVTATTLDAQLAGMLRSRVADSAWFCPFPRCEVVYFDAFDRMVTDVEFGRPVFPKDPSAPICNCFGLTLDDIEADLREGSPRRVKELLAKAKSTEAQCTQRAPSGQCCVADVQRTYMQLAGMK
jgi:hypothetical protein